MAAVTTKTLRMTFVTNLGKAVSFSLKNPAPDLTGPTIEAVMQTMIDKNIFLSANGSLVAKKDIKIIESITDDLYDVPIM